MDANAPSSPGGSVVREVPSSHPRVSAVNLLIALAFLFVTAPFVEELPHGDLVQALLIGLGDGFRCPGGERQAF
jgi:hypothetical protein